MKIQLRKKWLAVSVILLSLLFGHGILMADIVLFQDDFNTENGGVGILNYTSFANWTVTDGTVDLIGNGFYDFYPGNGLYVDLDGSSYNAGVLTSKTSFTFLPKIWYYLYFDLKGSARGDSNDVTVNVSFASQTWTISSADVWDDWFLAFIDSDNTHTTPITFSNSGGDNVGAILDNVRLVQIGNPVPLPPAIWLLGSGLIGLAAVRRKFRK